MNTTHLQAKAGPEKPTHHPVPHQERVWGLLSHDPQLCSHAAQEPEQFPLRVSLIYQRYGPLALNTYTGALTSSFVFPHSIRRFHPALLLSTPGCRRHPQASGGTRRPQADGGMQGLASWASPVCHPEHTSGSDKVMPLRQINRYLLSELWLQGWDREHSASLLLTTVTIALFSAV